LISSRLRVSALVLFLAESCVAGCIQLPPAMPAAGMADLAVEPTMWVVTTRKAVNGARADPWFGSERASRMSIARVRLASPALAGRFSLAATGLVDWQIERVERVPTLSVGQSFAGRVICVTFSCMSMGTIRVSQALRSTPLDCRMPLNSTVTRWRSAGHRATSSSTTLGTARARYGHVMRLRPRSRACLPIRPLATYTSLRIAWAAC